ncbi:DUF983 domain-containing protein [Algimonas porphyrae]
MIDGQKFSGPQPTGPLRPKLIRGLKMQCPSCGEAKLFRRFLKPVEHCPSCGVNWGDVRADDGPAWASMLVAGHLVAPAFHWVVFKEDWPIWASVTGISLLLALLCITLLQPMKGVFMAIIWDKGAPTSG